MTRIKYQTEGDGVLVTTNTFVGNGMLLRGYLHSGGLQILVRNETGAVVGERIVKNLSSGKKALKSMLRELGVNFSDEVRKKKVVSQAA
jgi:hypothetical protein